MIFVYKSGGVSISRRQAKNEKWKVKRYTFFGFNIIAFMFALMLWIFNFVGTYENQAAAGLIIETDKEDILI